MSEPFLGEMRIFGFNFPPLNWAFCDGQILSIQQHTALFALLGTFYGGNGTTTFALPNFQGRSGVQQGTGPGLSTYAVGELTGERMVTLTLGDLPLHNHAINTKASGAVTQAARIPTPQAFLGTSSPDALYNDATPNPTTMFAPATIGFAGGGQPHDNLQPYQVVNFCISLAGIFPSRG
jgi:microcystin-dependent protein